MIIEKNMNWILSSREKPKGKKYFYTLFKYVGINKWHISIWRGKSSYHPRAVPEVCWDTNKYWIYADEFQKALPPMDNK